VWLIFVILIEDSRCKLRIVIEKIGKRNEEILAPIADNNLSFSLVLVDSFVRKVLYEVGELLADGSSKVDLVFPEVSLHEFNFLKLLF